MTITGSSLRGSTFALIGPAAEKSLATIHALKAFLSGNGLSAERGQSTPNATVASMDRAMTAAARQVIVLADHTKVGIDAMVQTVPVEGISTLVTDAETDRTQLDALRAAGVDVSVPWWRPELATSVTACRTNRPVGAKHPITVRFVPFLTSLTDSSPE